VIRVLRTKLQALGKRAAELERLLAGAREPRDGEQADVVVDELAAALVALGKVGKSLDKVGARVRDLTKRLKAG
jgi:hypothetical protein